MTEKYPTADSLWPNSVLEDAATPGQSAVAGANHGGKSARWVCSNTPQGVAVELHGRWTAVQLARVDLQQHLHHQAQALPASTPVRWDLCAIQRFDHVGAQWLWNTWGQQWPAELQTTPDQRAMLERVARFTVPQAAVPLRTHVQVALRKLLGLFLGLGSRALRLWEHLADVFLLMGQLTLDIGRLLRSPRNGPWRDISGNLYRIGATALPITALVGFLIGVVLAYLMARQLRQFGADACIVDVLGIALIRELGPVLAAILLAGRSGSAITAQIGVMQVTEELDAMKVMGISPGFRLVMPKALAMAIAMPLVAVWTTLAALVGGMLTADIVLGITPSFFFMALPQAVEASNLVLAVSKSVVFGLLIAIIGCHYGLRVLPNTESLGRGTTASVVTSITMVILVNSVFALVFRDVGI
jgi:phospholipid/cholesterol/gamma-HCH transport system permease protein